MLLENKLSTWVKRKYCDKVWRLLASDICMSFDSYISSAKYIIFNPFLLLWLLGVEVVFCGVSSKELLFVLVLVQYLLASRCNSTKHHTCLEMFIFPFLLLPEEFIWTAAGLRAVGSGRPLSYSRIICFSEFEYANAKNKVHLFNQFRSHLFISSEVNRL